jgi:hypothetical protein
MTTTLKMKMEKFLESISEVEKRRNKKLSGQIEFLRKYLGNSGDGSGAIIDDSEFDLQKYFNFQLKEVRG